MRPAIIYDDNKIFIELSPQEFIDTLQEYINNGKSVQESISLIIQDLKKKTLTM